MVVTDHKPFEDLWHSRRKPSLRLERIQLRHQHINYTVAWRKGKDNPADYLSRHAILIELFPQQIKEAKTYEKLIYMLHTTRYTNAITPMHIHKALAEDQLLQKLKSQIHLGQPPPNNQDPQRSSNIL